jgi:hypothetical protein
VSTRSQASLPDWRAVFPEAAAEISVPFEPLTREYTDGFGEGWWSSQYSVTKRFYEYDTVFGSRHGMIYLGISNVDQTARRDFRHFQAIKNQLAGEEWEGMEIYPAESRLVDPSNLFIIWCFHVRLKVGPLRRTVVTAEKAFAPQRAFAEEKENGEGVSLPRGSIAER